MARGPFGSGWWSETSFSRHLRIAKIAETDFLHPCFGFDGTAVLVMRKELEAIREVRSLIARRAAT